MSAPLDLACPHGNACRYCSCRDFIITALDLDPPYRTTTVRAKTAAAAKAKVALSALDAGWYGGDFGRAVARLRVHVAVDARRIARRVAG